MNTQPPSSLPTPERPGLEPQDQSPELGTIHRDFQNEKPPTFPTSRWSLLEQLAGQGGTELVKRLRPFLAVTAVDLVERWQEDLVVHGTDEEAALADACFQELKATWQVWALMPERLSEDLGSWSPQFKGLRSYLSGWAFDYRAWEAQERLRPALRPEEDWRLAICRWVAEGRPGPKPEIPRWEIACDVIPTWEEDRTWLTLLPAPWVNPPYLPAVVELPPGAGSILGLGELRLKQRSMVLEAEPLILALAPPLEARKWLLRYAHLAGAAWISA